MFIPITLTGVHKMSTTYTPLQLEDQQSSLQSEPAAKHRLAVDSEEACSLPHWGCFGCKAKE